MAGQKREQVQCRGLVTDPNELSIVGDGAMRTFTNLVLKRANLMESRRGFTRLVQNGSAINKLFNYDGVQLLHSNPNVLKRQSGGVITAYSGTVAPVSGRLRGCIAGKNFYMAGQVVTRLSGFSGVMTGAGGLFAPGFDREATTYPAGTVLLNTESAAYRYLFGFTDAKGNTHLGEPSGRLVVTNGSGVTSNVGLRAIVPSTGTAQHFIQIFRSQNVAGGTQPDDDLQLVYERQLNSLDLSQGYVAVTDIVPENLRGAFIYTAPNAGEGEENANLPPPQCVEICTHRDRMWVANTLRGGEFFLQILAVGGGAGIQNTDELRFGAGPSFTVTATTGAGGAGQYVLVTSGTASFNIEATAQNLVAAINKHASNTGVWARYVSGPTDVPGRILVRGRDATTGAFTIQTNPAGQRACWMPNLTPDFSSVAWSLTRVGATVTATISAGTHSLVVGEQVLMTSLGSADFPVGVKTITAVTANTFDYAEAGAAVTLAGQVFSFYPTDIATADVENKPNRVYVSKLREYEAFPRQNWLDCGSEDSAILAMVPQRGQIWVWKATEVGRIIEDGEWYRYETLDANCRALAPESVVAFAERCWGLTSRGIVALSESGVEVMSNRIANDLRTKVRNLVSISELADVFAVAYESEQLVAFFTPGDRDLEAALGSCKEAYVFQNQTSTWSLWDYGGGNGKRCAVVGADDDLLYFGDQYNGLLLDSYIYQERKALTAADYLDTTGANEDTAITHTATWIVQTASAPSREKRWDEVAFMFVGTQPTFDCTIATAEASSGPTSIASQGTRVARIWPASEVSRGSQLAVTARHSVASEGFSVAGLAVLSEVLDGATTR